MENETGNTDNDDVITSQADDGSNYVTTGKDIEKSNTDIPLNTQYEPKSWERILAIIAAIAWIGLVGFLVIRNEPLAPNLVVFVRIILSVMAGILGAVIPGFLAVGIQGPGFAIRAGGALALFVISYFFTPTVLG